jgi:hypothetical protein
MTDMLVPRGDSTTVTFVLTKANLETQRIEPFPINDVAHEFWMTVKDDTSRPDSEAFVQKRLSSPGDMTVRAAPLDNVVDVHLLAGEVALMLGDYFYDAQVRVNSTGEVRTVDMGRFTVVPDVTRAT